MNTDVIKGKWTQIKGEARSQWGKLTDDEVDQIAGDRDKLIGKIQEKYGIARNEAEAQVNDWLSKV
ncbi:CsbD family protein [Rhodobacteraceae bacterium 2376]|uniref:CsbD family protein n=1 Tax=Rhabdonatronobacter sediminivivens TaxID=2743469 RepID=A0A7Z0I0A7_9RHOB|nr:CsbD family protein [Rhabdonatronobacter sediminivivens]NYS25576.1 CsbD family protein [Rhabdonatronobacter sediminivivens]